MDLRDDIKRRWNEAAEWFRQEATDDPNREHTLFPRLRHALKERLGTLDGKLILDAGCGEGRLARALADDGARVVGADFSSLIDYAKEPRRGGNPTFVRADLAELRRDDAFKRREQFDAILCNLVLQGAVLLPKILEELARLLKPNGALFLVLHNSDVVLPASPWFAHWEPQPTTRDPDGGQPFLVRIRPDAPPVYYFHRQLDTYRRALAAANFDLPIDEPIQASAEFIRAMRLQKQRDKSLFRLLVAQRRALATPPEWQERPITEVPDVSGLGGSVLALLAKEPSKTRVLFRSFRRWEPIVQEGHDGGDLFIILSGNATPYSSPFSLTEILDEAHQGTEKLEKLLDQKGEWVRYVLGPGELVGEFEVLSPRRLVSNVLAGTTFALLHTKSDSSSFVAQAVRVPHAVIENCSQDRGFRTQFQTLVYRSFDRKVATLVHLTALPHKGPTTQLAYLLWMCFKGFLPLTTYALADGSLHPSSGPSSELTLPRADHLEQLLHVTVHNQFLEFMLGRDPHESVLRLQGLGAKRASQLEGLFDFSRPDANVEQTRHSQRIKVRSISIRDRLVLDTVWRSVHGRKARTD